MAWGVTMADGTPVLGNVELKGRALMLAVTSAERAKRGTALINDALAGLVGSPLTTMVLPAFAGLIMVALFVYIFWNYGDLTN